MTTAHEARREERPKLSLYAFDRPALKGFSAELKAALLGDDRKALATMLGLGAGLAEKLATGPRAVDWFLRPDGDPEASALFASLRRVAKKRALEKAWTSDEPSLEGRLRNFDLLREDPKVAGLIDKLLDSERLPWYLVRPGGTGGWLDEAKRLELARAMRGLLPALPKELSGFARALADMDGAVIAHDAL